MTPEEGAVMHLSRELLSTSAAGAWGVRIGTETAQQRHNNVHLFTKCFLSISLKERNREEDLNTYV